MTKDIIEAFFENLLVNLNKELDNYEKIATIVIITKEVWSEKNNLLTPTLKIKRNENHKTYNRHYMDWFNHQNKIIWEA